MATIEALDEKIEKKRREIAQYETRKRAILAKEREQARKWKAETLQSIGTIVVDATHLDYKAINLSALHNWLYAHAQELSGQIAQDVLSPADAKAALDEFKKWRKTLTDDPNDNL